MAPSQSSPRVTFTFRTPQSPGFASVVSQPELPCTQPASSLTAFLEALSATEAMR
jgi:hypothetical protein